MNIKEAIYERHTVRKYQNKKIPKKLISLLNKRVEENNKKFDLNIKLVTGNSDALMGFAKFVFSKGVNNYFILAGTDTPDLDVKLGYAGADLALYAQTLGLNTWWIGGMVDKKGAERNLNGEAGRINGIITVGYGVTNGKQHKLKKPEEIAVYKGVTPDWFREGVEALLHAPTAMNRQAFKVIGKGHKVLLKCNNGSFSGVDLGIGKYHFEVGAGKENFKWK